MREAVFEKSKTRKEKVMKLFTATLIFLIAITGYTSAVLAMQGMTHGNQQSSEAFIHEAMADDIHSKFQVMDLANMNIVDPEGKTHHVMVNFSKDGVELTKAVGKIKLIAPSGKEQTATLKDYGGGTFAANFSIDEAGKWGVICLFKDESGTHTVKFWYPHSLEP